MRISTVIDPAHGGSSVAGRSSPYGTRGPGGLLEKEVTLGLARRIASQLSGTAQLTRSGDQNPSLQERASAARRFGARAFVSLHAGDNQAPEIWVHTRASPRSGELANHLRQELARFGAKVRRGDLAVLHPEAHGPEGACLVEVGGLSNPAGERRLRDPRHLDEVSRAVAAGISRFLDGGSAYGRGPGTARALALNLTDFDVTQFSVVPDDKPNKVPNNVTAGELDVLKQAWDRMMTDTGLVLSEFDLAKPAVHDFRVMLLDCMATSRVLRDAFLFITSGPTLNLQIGRSQPKLLIDGFEYRASTDTSMRGWHSIDLDDYDKVPRVANLQHPNMSTRTHYLIHALVEAGTGVRSTVTNHDVRNAIAHIRGIDEENRYRQEQGMQGTKDITQPHHAGINWEFHFTNLSTGADIASETWNMTGVNNNTIDHIDYF
jgi:N-acetylmuramoyl-L-alanine amidase